jgi:hypothetical protein
MPGIDSMPPIRSFVTVQPTAARTSSAPSSASCPVSSRDVVDRVPAGAASTAR